MLFRSPLSPQQLVEKNALIGVFKALGGASWNRKNGWDVSGGGGSPCGWSGVRCNAAGLVTSLLLDANNLVGTFPNDILSLSSLTSLRLGRNPKLTGSFPSNMAASFPYLTTLFVNKCGMSGAVPVLPNSLKVVNLSINSFTSLPSSLPASLTSLELNGNKLFANGTDASRVLPSSLWTLTQLETLGLARTGLRGPVPADLARLQNLTFLDLSGNELVGILPAAIGELPYVNAM